MPVAKQSNFVQDNPDYSANSPKTALLSDGVRLFLVAGTSSLAAKTSVAPLDRGRIIAQTGVGGSASSSGVISIFRHVLRSEGPLGLWKGNVANCMRVFPSRGILFASHDLFKDAMRKISGNSELPTWASFVSGSAAGTTSNSITYPLDLARTRLAASIGQNGTSTTVIGILKGAFQSHGIRGLYHGVGITLVGTVVYEGAKFGFYDYVRSFRSTFVPEDPSALTEVVWKLSCGAIAGTAAGMITYPNDTVRKLIVVQRAQMDASFTIANVPKSPNADSSTSKKHICRPLHFNGAIDCYRQIWRVHGLARFYQGISTYLLRAVPNAAVQFTAFEYLKKMFVKDFYRD